MTGTSARPAHRAGTGLLARAGAGAPSSRARAGFTLVELIVALVLLALLALMTGRVLVSSQRTLISSKHRSDALQLASSVLAQAETLGCGLGVDVADPTSTSSAAAVTTRCTAAFTDTDPTTPAPVVSAGDAAFTYTATSGEVFSVELDSRWDQVSGDGCVASAGGRAGLLPDVLTRTVSVHWPDNRGQAWAGHSGLYESLQVTAAQALPDDDGSGGAALHDASLGGVRVATAAAGASVWLSLDGGLSWTWRHSVASTSGPCAWFPLTQRAGSLATALVVQGLDQVPPAGAGAPTPIAARPA